MGSSTSGVGACEAAYRQSAEARGGEGGELPGSFKFDETHDFYSLPRFVAALLNLDGPSTTVSAACASSSKVFADAWQWIEAGICDAAVVGGVDSLCRMTLRGFNSLELLSQGPCRPNDAERSGLSIGEAAGFALLERVETPDAGAIALLGYGESSDAYHMSAPHPEGKGAILAMEAALARAGLAPGDIDYINLHGTGTRANDRTEDLAITEIFGASVPTSSTKGWSGHCLGAAGITDAVIAYLCLREGFIPANLNLERLDPDFKSNVQRHSAEQPLTHVLSNSFGFGGSNCSILLGRVS
jgi:3-oxoacyl-[acyl-carrier-protein] synthase-1